MNAQPDSDPQPISGMIPARRLGVVRGSWLLQAQAARDEGAVLLALWGSDERDRGEGFVVRAALLGSSSQVSVLELAVAADAPAYPSLASIFPAAGRMERALYDLLGVRAEGGDARPWLRHAGWPQDQFPLRRDFNPLSVAQAARQEVYPFVRVEGDGVHEIAVGPVHAGIIEPGHFRFSVVGEKVLRLEARLGYVHKGIEKRFEQLSLIDGQRLAARVSGDSAVAYSWAYCMALEGLCGVTPPPRALHLRALALERERIANHLGDLGALGNDAGFGVGLAHFSRLKEDLLRLNALTLGARYPMDELVPGGVAHDLSDELMKLLLEQSDQLERQVRSLRGIYDEHAGVQDRFIGAGRVTPALAVQLGLSGLAGRASGQGRDLRCDLPASPYDRLSVNKVGHRDGDVAARVAVRFDETLESLRLCRAILSDLPAGAVRTPLAAARTGALGVGLVEGWRGPVLVALEAGADQRIRRCHPHDPSSQNWPLLEHAVIGNIVPDFPLINKSFNLSYSGQDL
jgi:Ni,Fe-hydrogenase III large subunit/Ni,Fe-hydrogenase III component G